MFDIIDPTRNPEEMAEFETNLKKRWPEADTSKTELMPGVFGYLIKQVRDQWEGWAMAKEIK